MSPAAKLVIAVGLFAWLLPRGQATAAGGSPGQPLWLARLNGPDGRTDFAQSVAASPDGTKVFVTGIVDEETNGDYGTEAYDSLTGAPLWTNTYDGSGGFDIGQAAAASPDGAMVFVTGSSTGVGTGWDFATLGIDAATGLTVWTSRFNGPASGDDQVLALSVSPDGGRVYVTGSGLGLSGYALTTVAYDSHTGEEQWVASYGSPSGSGRSVAVSPDGGSVFVAGVLPGGPAHDANFGTIAYDAATGAMLWVRTFDGSAHGDDVAFSVAVTPDGSRVLATGYSSGATGQDMTTLAYDAATGTPVWKSRYDRTGRTDIAFDIAVGPDGSTAFVTGYSTGLTGAEDYTTIAYDVATGARLWLRGYNGTGDFTDMAFGVTVSPDGTEVFVTGQSDGGATHADYATISYGAATGANRWVARYDGHAHGAESAGALAVSPDGTAVFVTGQSDGIGTNEDYATVAYSA